MSLYVVMDPETGVVGFVDPLWLVDSEKKLKCVVLKVKFRSALVPTLVVTNTLEMLSSMDQTLTRESQETGK